MMCSMTSVRSSSSSFPLVSQLYHRLTLLPLVHLAPCTFPPVPCSLARVPARPPTHGTSPVICANKALLDSHPSLSDQLSPLIRDRNEPSIVLFQNGVGAEEPLHVSFPGTTVISACVSPRGRVSLEFQSPFQALLPVLRYATQQTTYKSPFETQADE